MELRSSYEVRRRTLPKRDGTEPRSGSDVELAKGRSGLTGGWQCSCALKSAITGPGGCWAQWLTSSSRAGVRGILSSNQSLARPSLWTAQFTNLPNHTGQEKYSKKKSTRFFSSRHHTCTRPPPTCYYCTLNYSFFPPPRLLHLSPSGAQQLSFPSIFRFPRLHALFSRNQSSCLLRR